MAAPTPETRMDDKPPLPPFTPETAAQKDAQLLGFREVIAEIVAGKREMEDEELEAFLARAQERITGVTDVAIKRNGPLREALARAMADAVKRSSARPPSLRGLSRRSPAVAPSGRVRMKADQNSTTRLVVVNQ